MSRRFTPLFAASSASSRLILCSAILAFSGCISIGSDAGSKSLFGLNLHDPTIASEKPKTPGVLLIRNVQGLALTDTTKLIYQPKDSQYSTYQLSQWVEPPTLMLGNELVRIFQHLQMFDGVTRTTSSIVGDYQLNAELREFTYRSESKESVCSVTLFVELVNLHTHALIAQREFSAQEKVDDPTPEKIVQGLTTSSDRLVQELASWIGEIRP